MPTLDTYALTTLENAKEHLRLGTSTDDDQVVVNMVNRASAFIESYLGRNILTRTYTETYDGHGGVDLYLRQLKVTSITSISLEDEASVAVSTDILLYQNEGMICFDDDVGRLWTRGRQNISIVYVAGYLAVPADVEMAVLEIIQRKWQHRKNQDQAITSTSEQGRTISFSAADLLPETKLALDFFRLHPMARVA